jgi:hypothetical protein
MSFESDSKLRAFVQARFRTDVLTRPFALGFVSGAVVFLWALFLYTRKPRYVRS